MAEEFVFGVLLKGDIGGVGAALEGLGEEDVAKEGLYGTAGGDEALGEVIEEFGVSGEVAEFAEVVGGGDEAAAEDVMPEAVDDDAGGEGIARHVGHVSGEFEPAALGGVEGGWIEGVEEAAGDEGGGLFVIATDKEGGVLGVGFDDAGDAGGGGELGFEFVVFFEEGSDGGEGEFLRLDEGVEGFGVGIGEGVGLPGGDELMRGCG